MDTVIIVLLALLAVLLLDSPRSEVVSGVIEQGSMARYGQNRRIDGGGSEEAAA